MDIIQQQVLRAVRRLFLQNWLYWLQWSLIACFSLCFIGLILPKFLHIELAGDAWVWSWLIGAGVLAILSSFAIAWYRKPSTLQAAVEIDRRYKLRERCSSALAIEHSERDSAIGQALVQDAQKRVGTIDLRDQFPVRLAPQWAWVMLPLAACLALF